MDRSPRYAESIAYARSLGKPTVADLLSDAARDGRTLVQPRSGVGDHDAMLALLLGLEHRAQPDVATITIDSYTRLLQLSTARRALRGDAGTLNGYPLVSHGWRRGRELDELVRAPLQVRHGSPDARLLFRDHPGMRYHLLRRRRDLVQRPLRQEHSRSPSRCEPGRRSIASLARPPRPG